jgi:hypothetical protein
LADLVEKHEPRGGVEMKNWKWRLVDAKTAIREGHYQIYEHTKKGPPIPQADDPLGHPSFTMIPGPAVREIIPYSV